MDKLKKYYGRVGETPPVSDDSTEEDEAEGMEYEVEEILMSNGDPPYEIVLGTPIGAGRMVAAKYGG